MALKGVKYQPSSVKFVLVVDSDTLHEIRVSAIVISLRGHNY